LDPPQNTGDDEQEPLQARTITTPLELINVPPRCAQIRRCSDLGATPIVSTSRLFRPRASIACAVKGSAVRRSEQYEPIAAWLERRDTRSAADLGWPGWWGSACPDARMSTSVWTFARLALALRPRPCRCLSWVSDHPSGATARDPRDCSELTNRKALLRKEIRDQVGTTVRSEQSAILSDPRARAA
jgi:hypothetical protein